MIIFLLTLLVVELGFIAGWLIFNSRKIIAYLTYNTRYEAVEYETAITTPKIRKPSLPLKKTEKRGREIKEVPDLVDLQDLDPELGMDAVEAIGQQ